MTELTYERIVPQGLRNPVSSAVSLVPRGSEKRSRLDSRSCFRNIGVVGCWIAIGAEEENSEVKPVKERDKINCNGSRQGIKYSRRHTSLGGSCVVLRPSYGSCIRIHVPTVSVRQPFDQSEEAFRDHRSLHFSRNSGTISDSDVVIEFDRHNVHCLGGMPSM